MSSKKKSIIFDFGKTWIAYAVLILLIIGSVFIKDIVEDRMNSELNTEFEKAYSSVISRLNNQYDKLFQVMQTTQGLYYQNEEIVRDYFELNGAVPVRNFTSIMSLNYVAKVQHRNWSKFHFDALCQGYNAFNLHPQAVREYYYPVLYIVNYELNMHRLAFDYASQDEMKNAIELAQSRNVLVATELFNLRPDTLSFALIAPIYDRTTNFSSADDLQNKFKGSVVMEINADTYFNTAIKGSDVIGERTSSFPTDTSIYYCIIDRNSEGEENIVFKSNNFDALYGGAEPLLRRDVLIGMADRELMIKFATVPGFGVTQANLPNIVLIVSILLSVLAFILILVLLTQKARAEEIAERMTASQRRILEISRDIIAVASKEGNWLSMNPASIMLLGETSDKVVGKNISEYLYGDKDLKLLNEVLASKDENQRVDMRVKAEKGFLWLNFSFTKPQNEDLIYIICRDVTAEKEAAEEIKFRSKQIELANCFEQEASSTKVNLMIQLSHEMRNQLTGMMGYLQLITSGAFDNEEELQIYAGTAYESAESAFTYIHDISEATIGDTATMSKVAVHKIEDTINPVLEKYNKENKHLNIKFAEYGKEAHIIVDNAIIFDVWTKIFRILTINDSNNIINFTANENKLEGVTEIIIEAASNPDLAKMTEIYNEAPSKVIERLREDVDDIMLDLAMTASFITRMMGGFNIENMDNGKTTYIFITLPLVLRIRE